MRSEASAIRPFTTMFSRWPSKIPVPMRARRLTALGVTDIDHRVAEARPELQKQRTRR